MATRAEEDALLTFAKEYEERLIQEEGDKVVPHIENEHDDLIVALVLLDYAMTLRMYGECAPGGTETWRAWDTSTSAFLRRLS